MIKRRKKKKRKKKKEQYVDDVGQIVDKVFVNGRIGGVHAEHVFVAGLERFEMGVVELVAPLQRLLLDQFELFRLVQLLLGDRRLQFGALRLHVAQFGLGLSVLDLVRLRRLHGRVQFVQHLQQLFVTLVTHFTALQLTTTKKTQKKIHFLFKFSPFLCQFIQNWRRF